MVALQGLLLGAKGLRDNMQPEVTGRRREGGRDRSVCVFIGREEKMDVDAWRIDRMWWG